MGTTDDESVKQIRAAEAAKKAEEKRAHDASVRLEPTTADLEILSGGITSTKLAAAKFEPIKWFIDDLLPEGLAILAGKSGSGKSYLALQIACDVAAGKPLFGKFPTRPLRVAYLSYEDDLRICQKRQAECGFPISDNLKIFPKFETGTKGLRLLEILAKEEGVSLVIADTWSWFRGAEISARPNSDSYHAVVAELGVYKTVAQRAGFSLMLNHHVNKNPAASGDPFDAILGSTAIKGTCDSRLSLVYQHDRSERKLWVQGRVIQTTSHVIDLQPDSGWSYVADGASYAETTEQQEILDIMDADDAMSPKDVATQLDKNPSTVRGLFGALELEGKIVRQSRGRYTRAY